MYDKIRYHSCVQCIFWIHERRVLVSKTEHENFFYVVDLVYAAGDSARNKKKRGLSLVNEQNSCGLLLVRQWTSVALERNPARSMFHFSSQTCVFGSCQLCRLPMYCTCARVGYSHALKESGSTWTTKSKLKGQCVNSISLLKTTKLIFYLSYSESTFAQTLCS